jgi:hypothetical protein
MSDMRRVRPLPASAVAALLVAVATLAYQRRERSSVQRAAVSGPAPLIDPLENPPPRPLPDFVEVGPDQYKMTSACSDAEVQSAIRRLRRQAESLAAQAGTARRDGDERSVHQLMGRAVAAAGKAQAFQRFLDSRHDSSV